MGSSSKKRGSTSSRKLMSVPEALNDASMSIDRKKEKRSSSGKKFKSKSKGDTINSQSPLPSKMVRSASSRKSLSVPVTLNGITLNGTITPVVGKTKESAKIPKA